MRLLDERRALVTGGANGIGRAIVERFVAEGAAVATVDVEQVDDVGPNVLTFRRDLAETDDLDATAGSRQYRGPAGPSGGDAETLPGRGQGHPPQAPSIL